MEAKLLALVKSLLYLRRIQEPPLKFKRAENIKVHFRSCISEKQFAVIKNTHSHTYILNVYGHYVAKCVSLLWVMIKKKTHKFLC